MKTERERGAPVQTPELHERLVEQARELERSREYLREIVAAIPCAVFWKDRDLRYLGCNRSFAEAVGAGSPDDLIGKTDFELPYAHEEAVANRADDMTVLLSGMPRMHTVETIRRDDGSMATRDTSKVPLRDEAGGIAGVIGVHVDVTEQTRLHAQVATKQKMESIGRLAAGIAHEINTPVQYVNDNIEFLKGALQELLSAIDAVGKLAEAGPEGASPDDFRVLRAALDKADVGFIRKEIPDAIRQSLEGIVRISTIVNSMKDFSRSADEKAPADLNQAIQSTVIVGSSDWKDVAEVEMDLDPALPSVHCLVGAINQVVLSILINAAQAIRGASPGDRGRIRIATRHEGSGIEIVIADNGPGMPASVRDRIFEPFYTTRDVGEGTGQGLAVAHRIVRELHGGRIEVESEPGRGATFRIRLPLA